MRSVGEGQLFSRGVFTRQETEADKGDSFSFFNFLPREQATVHGYLPRTATNMGIDDQARAQDEDEQPRSEYEERKSSESVVDNEVPEPGGVPDDVADVPDDKEDGDEDSQRTETDSWVGTQVLDYGNGPEEEVPANESGKQEGECEVGRNKKRVRDVDAGQPSGAGGSDRSVLVKRRRLLLGCLGGGERERYLVYARRVRIDVSKWGRVRTDGDILGGGRTEESGGFSDGCDKCGR